MGTEIYICAETIENGWTLLYHEHGKVGDEIMDLKAM